MNLLGHDAKKPGNIEPEIKRVLISNWKGAASNTPVSMMDHKLPQLPGESAILLWYSSSFTLNAQGNWGKWLQNSVHLGTANPTYSSHLSQLTSPCQIHRRSWIFQTIRQRQDHVVACCRCVTGWSCIAKQGGRAKLSKKSNTPADIVKGDNHSQGHCDSMIPNDDDYRLNSMTILLRTDDHSPKA